MSVVKCAAVLRPTVYAGADASQAASVSEGPSSASSASNAAGVVHFSQRADDALTRIFGKVTGLAPVRETII
jgi:hypothetical protein